MATDSGNVAASIIFLFCFMVFIFPVMQYFGGLPPASIFTNALGMSYGEVVVCALIIGIVFVWSISQVGVTIFEAIIELLMMITTNEKVRMVSGAITAWVLHVIRREVYWIRTEIKKRESL
jgi:hypothetical protein